MNYLAMERIINPVPLERQNDVYSQEIRQVQELKKQGIIKDIYLTDKRSKAIIILKCNTLEEAKLHLSTLPMVNGQYIDFEILDLSPFPELA